MRLKRLGSIRLGLPLVLLAVFLRPLTGGIRPSFSLDYCSWHATHIMLVEVTPKDGVFSVVESWKGELQPGDAIAVPEFEAAPGAMPISLYPRRTNFFASDESRTGEQIPAQPVGARMVLFLKRQEGSESSPTSTNSKSRERWRPADSSNEMKTSVVWIDAGQFYSFQQAVNPGPSILVLWDSSLNKMKDRVTEIGRVQLELAKVVSTKDSVARAEGLKPYVRSEVYEAQLLALSELGKCGPSAMKTIREMLDDPAFADEAAELVRVFADAGGEAVGDELNTRLQEELAFWQATAPSLSEGWWNRDPTPHAPQRERYMQTWQLILALERTHYTPALITVKQLGNLWRALPQLNDASGLNQMAEECDKLADQLQAN
jgi:hypothetical protein